jgi:hypothetical protein
MGKTNVGAHRSYRHARKESWRWAAWEAIRDNLQLDGPVLYLAGPEDNDRMDASALGIPAHFLIAIDRSSENIRRVKSGGGLGLACTLERACQWWPDNWPVAAVMADFCCGICDSTEMFMLSLCRQAFCDAVVVINMLRGRDNPELADGPVKHPPYFHRQLSKRLEILQRNLAIAESNPGLVGAREIAHLKEKTLETLHDLEIEESLRDLSDKHRAVRLINELLPGGSMHLVRPPESYKSGTQVFDSAAFLMNRSAFLDSLRHPEDQPRLDADCKRGASLRRRIAAIKAHSTRRAKSARVASFGGRRECPEMAA